jgi:Integrase core domain
MCHAAGDDRVDDAATPTGRLVGSADRIDVAVVAAWPESSMIHLHGGLITAAAQLCGSTRDCRSDEGRTANMPQTCGLVASMGTIGDCFDNAVIESFWGRMQSELLDRRKWKTRLEIANAIFEYLEIFHNRQRRHSALGMLTPDRI